MPKVTYIEHDGSEHIIEVDTGSNLMEGAVNSGVPGIDAECGGACSCATCHIYVDEAWLDKLPPCSDMEAAMLECAVGEGQKGSRLACQITMEDVLNGLVLRIPEFQG